jgi:hypothetical protein
MKTYQFILLMSIAFLLDSCGSIYKKHYDNGYTFLSHKKKSKTELLSKSENLQQKSLNELSQEIKKEKQLEQKKSEETYQTYHKSLAKIQNNKPARLLSSINKFSLKKMESLKTDTLYRKEPNKGSSMAQSINDKARVAMILAIISLVLFWLLFILSLIPAIIALTMAKKANSMAKLNGDVMPSDANTAKIIAWVTIGLNMLALLLIIFYILFIILLFATI